jgi:hypothetical protein
MVRYPKGKTFTAELSAAFDRQPKSFTAENAEELRGR